MRKVLIYAAVISGGYGLLILVLGSNANKFRRYADVGWLDRLHDKLYIRELLWLSLIVFAGSYFSLLFLL